QFFDKYDLMLSPTVAVQPFEVGKAMPDGPEGKANPLWLPYTPQLNLSRHPAASVPCGLSRQGLPVGLQIAAGHYTDALVLRAPPPSPHPLPPPSPPPPHPPP